MTHLELVAKAAEKAGVDEGEARAVLDAAFETIVDEVADDGKVVVGGFGTFKCGFKRRSAKMKKDAPRKKKLVLTHSSTMDDKLGTE